jgi:putative transposase
MEMQKPVPLEFGEYYHVYNRGINRGRIFFEERNYDYFLQLYVQHVAPIAETYAYCLLPNHFHLLVRIRDLSGFPNLTGLGRKAPSQHFSNFFNAYAKAFNRTYNRTGSLFERPFGRLRVTSDAYFVQLVVYIHHNPQKHGLVDDFRDWARSSYHALLSERPTRLEREAVLEWFGGLAAFERTHGQEADLRLVAPLVPQDLD